MCITTLVSRYMSTYRRVQECSEMKKGVYGRAALYTGGQRDCAQEGSVAMAGGQRGCAQKGSVIHGRAA